MPHPENSVLFVIPGALRELAGNRPEIRLERAAGSLLDALSRLWTECPALRDRVMTETGDVRPHVNIFVDGQNMRDAGGLQMPVRGGAEVFLLPAVSGGETGRRRAGRTGRVRQAAALPWPR